MLGAGDFSAFFQAVHGVPPFAWQSELARRCVEDGIPGSIDVPTGCGKTAVIDAFVFAMAVDADRMPRIVPRRLFFVIDRRVVVDAAYDRARRIAEKLRVALLDTAQPAVLREVAHALSGLTGDDTSPPLLPARLRGGVAMDDAWTRDPAQPTVVCSTVDQVGSRLLFRGYGVSKRAAAIHAGLVGQDALIVLDEVHLSPAFDRSLELLREYAGPRWCDIPAPTPGLSVLRMSATPTAPADFAPQNLEEDPELAQRLAARRIARLCPVKAGGAKEATTDREAALQRALIEEWEKLRELRPEAECSVILVNRVARARQIFEALRARPMDGLEAMLVTGRARPVDADLVRDRLIRQAGSGWKRGERPGEPHLVVVSTQSLEAGADLDFDLLVTECASEDALRQRFGRLDRLGAAGKRDLAPERPRASVVYHPALHKDDPIYGGAIAATFTALTDRALDGKPKEAQCVDMSPQKLRKVPVADNCRTPKRRIATLLPAHLDHAAQTAPLAYPPLDVAPFLHALEVGPADVLLVWRGDIDAALLAQAPEAAIDRVSALPPVAAEGLPLSLSALRAWRGGGEVVDEPDVEGGPKLAGPPLRPLSRSILALRWAGVGSRVIPIDQARPGDVLVLPAEFGGVDAFGWAPSSRMPVPDRGEVARVEADTQPRLRVSAAAIPPESGVPRPPPIAALLEAVSPLATVVTWLEALLVHSGLDNRLRGWVKAILKRPRLRWMGRDGEHPALLVEGPRRRTAFADAPYDAASDASSLLGGRAAVGLVRHSGDVQEEATRIAAGLRLPPALSADLSLAGWLHDLGKADPRFQALLAGDGNDPLAEVEALLAKSARSQNDRAAERRARQRSRLPRGFRHESLSIDLADAWLSAHPGRAHDPELVLHLIASHHGHARPYFPPVDDPSPPDTALEWDGALLRARHRAHSSIGEPHVARFHRLQRRHGWHGLALLEACLRLADHRASAREAEGETS